jgi:hypothetical protein
VAVWSALERAWRRLGAARRRRRCRLPRQSRAVWVCPPADHADVARWPAGGGARPTSTAQHHNLQTVKTDA